MPGIIGLITKRPRSRAEPKLRKKVESLHHESFYVTETWIDELMGIYVGWVARRDSFSDRMPLQNERRDRVLIFSGEEYPEAQTALRLKERGHIFEDKGPAYLIHLSEEDASFPKHLNGRFHGLLTDQE